jgi:hypothetical protein
MGLPTAVDPLARGAVMAHTRLFRRAWVSAALCALLSHFAAAGAAHAQLAGTYHVLPGTRAEYVYHTGEYESAMLPVDITFNFLGQGPTSALTAIIHQPIIGDTPTYDYPIVDYFPMVVTGGSTDGRRYQGDLLGSQYFFDWEIDSTAGGELLLSGNVIWIGGRIEITTIENARLLPGIAGDYNQNGIVDAADYVVWRRTLGQTGRGLAADGDRDDAVSGDDYNVWKSSYDRTAIIEAPPSALGAVPEPATWLVLLILTAPKLGHSRRKQSPRLPAKCRHVRGRSLRIDR